MSSPKPKAVILTSQYFRPHFGGIENSFHHVAICLVQQGITPLIVVSNVGLSSQESLAREEVIDGISVYRYPAKKNKGLLAILSTWQQILAVGKLCRDLSEKFDLVGVLIRNHVPGLGVLRALPKVPTIYVLPGVVKLQQQPGQMKRSGNRLLFLARSLNARIMLPFHNQIQSKVTRQAGQSFVFSRVMQDQVKKYLGIAELPVIRPGVDPHRFFPSRDPAGRLRLGFAETDLLCISVCRLVSAKALDLCIRALVDLPPHVKLLLVGVGPEEGHLKKISRTLNVDQRVVFLGFQRNPEQYYQICDLFLMSSRYEPFGQTILEAMATGLPVIGFHRDDVNGVLTATGEIVKNSTTGWLGNFGVEHLVSSINKYHALSAEEKQQMSEQARSFVLAHYDWNIFTDSLLTGFEELRIDAE